MPADAAGWKGAIGLVENSIVDDELQTWAKAALSRGVKVVGLIDPCHSATGFRALGGAGVARVIDGTALGIPDDSAPGIGAPAPPLTGAFVFLYSSQSDHRSFEFPLADGITWHGEFTLRLARTLHEVPEASWAQVLAMTTDAMVQGPARQVPDGEGPMLQAQVFGQGRGDLRLPIREGKLAAGLLQGLSEGAEMAVFAGPAGGEPLTVMVLGKVTAREAAFVGNLPEAAAWAELISAPPPAALTLAAPVLANPGDVHDYAVWRAALPAPGPNPDLVPILVDDTVALSGAEGVLDPEGPGSSPRIRLASGEAPADAVARVLEHAAHGLRLRKVLAGATGRGLTTTPPLTMTVARRAGLDGCSARDL